MAKRIGARSLQPRRGDLPARRAVAVRARQPGGSDRSGSAVRAIAIMSLAAILAFSVWEEWINLLVGCWLIGSPRLLGFAHTRAMHFSIIAGAVVAFMALLELWLEYEKTHLGPAAHASQKSDRTAAADRWSAAAANALDLAVDDRVLLIEDLLRRRGCCRNVGGARLAMPDRCRPWPGRGLIRWQATGPLDRCLRQAEVVIAASRVPARPSRLHVDQRGAHSSRRRARSRH